MAIHMLLSAQIFAQVFDIVVAQDGSGDYFSVKTALDRGVSDNNLMRTLIFVKNGTYTEKVYLASSKKNVSLIGEDADSVIISWNDYSGKDGLSTANSYTFLAEGDDFYAENITFENSAGNVAQAVAIRTTGERQVFKNCKFLGFQDTYYAHKNRQYNYNCYIEGATDFIFGDATCVFENCTINCLQGGQYITAPSDTKLTSIIPSGTFYHGLLFQNCIITADENVNANTYYLGRPWQPNASSVYVSCALGDHIKQEGWSIWSGTNNHLSGCYAEYENVDASGVLIDTTNRVSWSKQLSYSEVTDYYNLNYFLQKDGIPWDPSEITAFLEAPSGVNIEYPSISWNPVDSAIGYAIYRDNAIIGFTTDILYNDMVERSGSYSYKIRAIGKYGNLSIATTNHQITNIPVYEDIPFRMVIHDKQLLLSEDLNIKIYTSNGILVNSFYHTNFCDLTNLSKGVFIFSFENKDGLIFVKKIAI